MRKIHALFGPFLPEKAHGYCVVITLFAAKLTPSYEQTTKPRLKTPGLGLSSPFVYSHTQESPL
jgi:hypothetical protein